MPVPVANILSAITELVRYLDQSKKLTDENQTEVHSVRSISELGKIQVTAAGYFSAFPSVDYLTDIVTSDKLRQALFSDTTTMC